MEFGPTPCLSTLPGGHPELSSTPWQVETRTENTGSVGLVPLPNPRHDLRGASFGESPVAIGRSSIVAIGSSNKAPVRFWGAIL